MVTLRVGKGLTTGAIIDVGSDNPNYDNALTRSAIGRCLRPMHEIQINIFEPQALQAFLECVFYLEMITE